ncbi:hypothetical protein TUN199_10736 [Pyrenophora tritici-repentis]|nr:hypothetical protein TUN205_10753 [Pyrenophora tritici-repentis]KAI0617267.1 hypothetical protein TUN199_10736 [Pyrenophora tritici-repentis]
MPIRLIVAESAGQTLSRTTVNEEEERIRAHSNRLPSGFYRTYYETSQTACCFVNRDTHPKHREFPDLKITADNAFQSIGSFSLAHDLKRERIERQLIWNKKIKSSSYISAFDDIGKFLQITLYAEQDFIMTIASGSLCVHQWPG